MRNFKNKKILITGGAGFIGSNLSQKLLTYGSKITIVDKARLNMPNVKSIKWDLSRFIFQDGLKEKFDFIFHLAGNSSASYSILEPVKDSEQNIQNTLMLLEALRKLKKSPLLIYFSSAAVYGISKGIPIKESDPTFPLSPYGVSKLAAEKYVSVYCQNFGVEAVILRPFSVYGPGQKKQVVYDLIKKIQENPKHLEVQDSPARSRDFIFIDDLIDAILLVITKGTSDGDVYNVASGVPSTLGKLVKIISQLEKVSPKVKYLPLKTPFYQERADISKLKALGYKAKVSFFDGLKATKEWIDNDTGN